MGQKLQYRPSVLMQHTCDKPDSDWKLSIQHVRMYDYQIFVHMVKYHFMSSSHPRQRFIKVEIQMRKEKHFGLNGGSV